VKTAYVMIVISRVCTRPMRSASTPASAPPIAETTSVVVASSPAWPVVSAKAALIAARESGRTW
jgi:hypothetical protein